jgi:hypothetical protein
MKASVSSKFVIWKGEVESSSVVLVRREDGHWCKFDKEFSLLARDLTSHSYCGLKEMFRKNGGWKPENLKWRGNHHCDYYDEKVSWQFWVPVLSEKTMRRWWRGSREEWDEWEVFPQSGFATSIFSVEGFKEFIEKNPGLGWDMQYMKQDKDDPHLWHHKGKDKNELWFPIIKSELKKARSSRLVCVNTINAALTEGREYKVKGEVDGLLQVVDDEGLLQEFMPSRFKES